MKIKPKWSVGKIFLMVLSIILIFGAYYLVGWEIFLGVVLLKYADDLNPLNKKEKNNGKLPINKYNWS